MTDRSTGVRGGVDPPGGPADDRATSPVVAVVALVAVLAVLAGVAGAGLLAVSPPEPAPAVALELSADADRDRIALTHLGGDALDVRTVRVRVAVDGERLTHQPPVPFFAARGFRSGPTGPFNSAADPRWTTGETASLRVASTNDPPMAAGSRVRVEVYVRGRRIARLTATA